MVELDELEGLGQAKRLTARICATIHNEFAKLAWLRFGSKDDPRPTLAPESDWLPRTVKPKQSKRSAKVNSDGQASSPTSSSPPKTRADAVARQVSQAFADMFGG
jgi:hypothetical protein